MSKSIWIVKRDMAILQNIFEHRILDAKSIDQAFFGNTDIKNVRRRLLELVKHGYLEKLAIFSNQRMRVGFAITKKGLSQITGLYAHAICLDEIRTHSPEHDIVLFHIRRCLERCSMVTAYATENMIRSCAEYSDSKEYRSFFQLRSDAAMKLETPVGAFKVALEYEDAIKMKDRYRSKLHDYYLRGDINFVVYVCSNAKTIRFIENIDREFTQKFKPKVFLATLDHVLSSSGTVTFANHAKSQIVLK